MLNRKNNKTGFGTTSLETDFIGRRGALAKILCTPYERKEWIIGVIKFRNTYYLWEFDTEEKLQAEASQTEKDRLFEYGGFKFEQYMTSSELNGDPNTSEPINSKEAFYVVVRTMLGQHTLVYMAEVDCCQGRKEHHKYIELKTSRDFDEDERRKFIFKRYKLIKWWSQSFLIGIPEVICGFRDDNSIVHRVESFKTSEIPGMCKSEAGGALWLPNVCSNFCDIFLQHIKDVVHKNDPRTVTLFHHYPEEEEIHHKQLKIKEDSKHNFIPQ